MHFILLRSVPKISVTEDRKIWFLVIVCLIVERLRKNYGVGGDKCSSLWERIVLLFD